MKRYLTWFVFIFTSLLIFATFYIGYRLFNSPIQWTILVLTALLVWLLPVVHWTSDANEFSKREIIAQQASFICLGFMSGLLVITLLRDLILIGLYKFMEPETLSLIETQSKGSIALSLAILFSAFGAWRTFKTLRVREVVVPIANLPEPLVGLKIAQITDLHIGPTIGKAYVERLVEKIHSFAPDITTLTGDIVDGNLKDVSDSIEPLGRLIPKGKIYYVPGNHEYYWSFDQVIPELKRLGIRVLLNQGELLSHNETPIWVGGVTDPAAESSGGEAPNVNQAAQGSESAKFKLFLSHRPDYAPLASKVGFNLQLSGHTHGGQFFPWTYVGKLFHRFYIGLMKFESMWIYVSPGTGTWGPPIRIGTTPEVTCIQLVRDPRV